MPHAAAARTETYALVDARSACFYARRALELTVSWLYQNDATLKLPYQENLSALIHEPTFKTAAGTAIFNKAVLITRLGNQAVHSHRANDAIRRAHGGAGAGETDRAATSQTHLHGF